MSSWYNNLISKTSSGIRGFLQAEADGDTEDDTHVCRVLRSYYIEKGRPFPVWLPPDPRSPPPLPVPVQNSVGAGYGGLGSTGRGPAATGGLKSLWDTPSSGQQQSAPTSLRHGGGRPAFGAQTSARNSPFAPQGQTQPDGRPMPQKQASFGREGAASAASGNSAQDRLKQRLWGGGVRTASPQSTGGGPFQPPPQQQQAPQFNAYNPNAGGDGGGGGYQQDYGKGNGRPGLPSGPRGGGLPSGPRMRG